MPGSNITRIEAAARAALIEVNSYDVTLDLTSAVGDVTGERTFRSRTIVRFRANEPGAQTFIDLIAATLHTATLNGVAIDADDFDPKRGLTLRNLAAENELIVEADCYFMNTGEGLHRFVDPSDNEVYLYSQFESREAGRVYACFDQPDLKATFTLQVTAPANWRVFSNGTAAEPTDTPDGKIWNFAKTPLVPTYITAIVAGPYVGFTEVHDGIPLGIYCRKSMLEFMSGAEAEDIFTVTKQGFDFFHQQFDYRYAFGKYDQIFVPEFNAGAMENAGCVTHSDDYMLFRSKQTELRYETRANTILHEMAHMWFGDLVTMRWWDDLWLNESFAEWAAHWACGSATKYNKPWTAFASIRKAWGMRQDQLSSTHPVAADAPDVETAETNFDGITYAKGAATLKQLVAYVGEDTFVSALRGYFKAHAFGNATLADLLGALQEASGRSLDEWAQAWLRTSSINTLRPHTNDDGTTYTNVSIEQSAPTDYPTVRPHRIALGLYDWDSGIPGTGQLVRRDRIELDVQATATTHVPQLVGKPVPPLLLVNDDDLTYAKIRLDPRSLATVVKHVARVDDSLARALCWSAAWDMNRDAELPTRDYVRMAAAGLPAEQSMGVIQGQLSFVVAALDRYADPEWAPTGYAEFATASWKAATESEPGSDQQLVWVRTFASCARAPQELARLTGLLNGDKATVDALPALKIDADLRWFLLQNLVARGAADLAAIEAEKQRDNTDQGARSATMARAMVPTAEAKAEAWRLAVIDTTVPNQTALAAMRGFSLTEHAHILGEYVEKYFAALGDIWEKRTSEVATNIANWLYPSWNVSQATVDRTNSFLDENPRLHPALRRALAEGRDTLQRALAARECDKAAG